MQFILDNLLAIIIGVTVLVIIFAMRMQSQEALIETADSYTMRKQQLAFVEVLERDMQGVYEVNDTSASDGVFSFHTRIIDESAGNAVVARRVVYQLVKAPGADSLTLYQIKRYQGPPDIGTFYNGVRPGTDVPTGKSVPSISRFVMRARSRDNQGITNPKSAQQIYVRFQAASTLKFKAQEHRTANAVGFEATYRPVALQSATGAPTL